MSAEVEPSTAARNGESIHSAPSSPSKKNAAMNLSVMQQVKSAEMFNAAVEQLKDGCIEDAILFLQEAEFFSPEDPTPLVAHAECFVFLCDLQSAIRYYRRALWIVQKRDNLNPTTQRPATLVPNKNLSSAIPMAKAVSISNSALQHSSQFNVTGSEADSRVSSDHDTHSIGAFSPLSHKERAKTIIPDEAESIQQFAQGFTSPLNQNNGAAYGQEPQEDATTSALVSVMPMDHNQLPHSPNWRSDPEECKLSPALFHETPEGGMQNSSSLWQNSRTQRMQKTASEVQLVDIQTRLAGLLDAMSLVLFSMCDFAAALQCSEDSLALVDDPVVQLHRCVFLISLQREEEAESLLEAHLLKFEDCSIQSSALLIQLYVNRQAFRPARMLLDKYSATARHEDCLTVARHIFCSKYERYRQKALEKRDVGTISKCIDVFPNDVELLFARGKIRIAEGDHRKSVKDLFRCVKETNGSHKEAIETMTSVLFTIGTSLDGEEGIQEAVVYYSESLKWRADNTLVLLARGDCYVKLEQYEEALADYRKIIQINPDDPTASKRIAFLHDLWGRKLYKQEKVKEAEVEFTNAIKECDTEPLFYYHRALCRFYLNEARYGLRDVLTCQQLNPTDPTIQAFVVRYLGSSDVPDTTKTHKQAELNKLVVKDPDMGTSYLTNANAPASSFSTKKVANKYYGRPSARITKVLIEAQDASEATGRGAMPLDKVIGSVHGATSRAHTGFVDFVCNNAPDGTLTVVKGSRTGMTMRDVPSRPQKIQQLKNTKLPSIIRRKKDTDGASKGGEKASGGDFENRNTLVHSPLPQKLAGPTIPPSYLKPSSPESEREESPMQAEETLPG